MELAYQTVGATKMKLSIPREMLLEPLQLVIGVVERRQTLPILSNVLLTVKEHALFVTATDLELELIGRSHLSENTLDLAQVTVPGRKLLDICRTLPPHAMLDLQLDKERLILRSGRSRFVLTTLPVESFPRFEGGEAGIEFKLKQKELNRLLQHTYFAMAQQDVRYYLNGLLIELKEGKLSMVATDGHRFAMSHSSESMVANTNLQVIMPRKGILELLRLLKGDEAEVAIMINQNQLRVQAEEFIFISKLVDGRFPDYERVLPKEPGNVILVDRDMLREALLRVAILSNEKFKAIQIKLLPGVLHILANNPEQEEAEETLPVDYQGEELDIAFNVTYLLDVLNTVDSGLVKLTFIDANSRMFMEKAEGDNSLFLVMPLQI